MEKDELISSGILELYTLRKLTSEESIEVESKMQQADLKRELESVQHAIIDYCRFHELNPPPVLRSQVMELIQPVDAAIPKKKDSGENNSLTYKYMIAASLAALIVSTFASWFFYSKWDEAERKYSGMLQDKNELSENYNVMKSAYEEQSVMLSVIREPGSKAYDLFPVNISLIYKARVYWNGSLQQTYVDALALPPVEKGSQLQLWCIARGVTMDAGVIINGQHGIQRMKDMPEAGMWFITLEPSGGSSSPDLGRIVMKSY